MFPLITVHNPLLTGAITWPEWLESMQYEAAQGDKAVLLLFGHIHIHWAVSVQIEVSLLMCIFFFATGPVQDDPAIHGIVNALTNLTSIVTQQMQIQVSRHCEVH